MSRLEWIILLVSAGTDFVITAGTSLMTAMVAGGTTSAPSHAVIILCVTGGLVASARTVQQGLKQLVEAKPNLAVVIPAQVPDANH